VVSGKTPQVAEIAMSAEVPTPSPDKRGSRAPFLNSNRQQPVLFAMLRDGTISSDGLDTLKLGYEFARDDIVMRRESLKRQVGQDHNVVIFKLAQSA
jgi:hypothetical protein